MWIYEKKLQYPIHIKNPNPSLASMIILLLWLYLCGTILLLGAAFNRVWTKKHPKP